MWNGARMKSGAWSGHAELPKQSAWRYRRKQPRPGAREAWVAATGLESLGPLEGGHRLGLVWGPSRLPLMHSPGHLTSCV
jgi:hypothetical protein